MSELSQYKMASGGGKHGVDPTMEDVEGQGHSEENVDEVRQRMKEQTRKFIITIIF